MKASKLLEPTGRVEQIVRDAVAEALEVHRRMGRSVVVWRDGKVVSIPPEEIPRWTPPNNLPLKN